MTESAVDDRVPMAYCAKCRAVIFRRSLEEHTCPLADLARATGDYYPGPEEPMVDLVRVRERALLAKFLVRLTLVMGALGALAFGLAVWWD